MGLGGSPSRSDASASRSSTSVSLPQKAYPDTGPANSRELSFMKWFLSLCLRLCTQLTYARLHSASSSPSTPLILAQVGVGPRSARINGGPCTTCLRSRENTCASIEGLSHLILCSLIRGRQQLGTPCLFCGSPFSRLRSRLTSTLVSSRLRALHRSCATSPLKVAGIAGYSL